MPRGKKIKNRNGKNRCKIRKILVSILVNIINVESYQIRFYILDLYCPISKLRFLLVKSLIGPRLLIRLTGLEIILDL